MVPVGAPGVAQSAVLVPWSGLYAVVATVALDWAWRPPRQVGLHCAVEPETECGQLMSELPASPGMTLTTAHWR